MYHNFKCQRCGYCCKSYRVLQVFPEDEERWKDRPDILEYFTQDYYELPCKFLKGDKCLIYEIRPKVCRMFPFYGSSYRKTCPGIKIINEST
jgi:Fe-S-cluster containining protein